MTLWLDAQLSPSLAPWFRSEFGLEAVAVRDLGLLHATDESIFKAARALDVVVLTKDSDFVTLLERLGPPPRVVWLTCGNTSNDVLTALLKRHWPTVRAMLDRGEPLVEVGSPTP